MTDPTPNPTPTPAPAPTPAPTPDAWHTGVEAETLGFWQNKGYDISDPKALASALTKNYRDAERHFGVPADQLLKLPKDGADPKEWRSVYQRLGAPAEAKDYDFSAVKDSAGNPIAAPLADAIRNTAFNRGLSKDAANDMAAEIVKSLDGLRASESAAQTAKIAEEKTKLKQNWGNDFDFNHLKAMEGARRLGITPEAVQALEGQIGYAAVMEAMRKIGAGTSEDTFVERGASGALGKVTTREGAVARKAELMADSAWAGRYLSGGVQEKQEMDALNIMISGGMAAA